MNNSALSFTVSVVIPAFNEEQSIGTVISAVRELYESFEILVIDDGSDDHTAANAERAGALVYRHPINLGNGAAIKTGIRNATGDILVFMNADGQHDPKDIQDMLNYFPDYDMVVGARSVQGQTSLLRALGNKVFNWLASYVAKFQIKDLTSGFRAVKAEIAKSFLYMLPNAYSYPTTITLGVLRSGFSMRYIPIAHNRRRSGTSNIKIIRDGVRFFIIIVKICTLFSPFRIFLPVSAAMFLAGLCYYAYTFFSVGRFTNMSALLLTSSVTIFMMGLISEQICQLRFERRSAGRDAHRLRTKNDALK
jgi:glycosyltransferase involved in cell wall biosynthesis